MRAKKDLLVFIILFLGVLLRIFAINWQLPYLYHTDEYRTVNYTLKMAATKSLNPQNFVYPSLYLYLMLFIYVVVYFVGKLLGYYRSQEDFAISFFHDPSTIYIVSRVVSATFGSLVMIFIYLLTKKIYNKKVATISLAITAFLPTWVMYSHFAKPDMAAVFLSILSFYFICKYYFESEDKFFYLSCIFLGLGTSVKYLPIITSIGVFYLFLEKNKRIDKKFIVGCFLIIFFFVLGTPYSILDLRNFLKDILGHASGTMKRDLLKGILLNLKNFIFMGNITPVIGSLCFLGLIWNIFVKKNAIEKSLFLIVIGYFILNSLHYLPGWWFLFCAFPYYIILAARFIDHLTKIHKYFSYFFIVVILFSFIESLTVVISFFLKDTRTYALEWIEKNIPSESKVLIDNYPYSPPLKMCRLQLERLYKKAVELNHYKKEYFFWQLKAYNHDRPVYEIYEIYHPPHEISTIRHEVEEAQKVRDLVDVSKGLDYVKSLGIRYIILNSFSETESTKNFYQEVNKNAKLISEFKPKTRLHPGPIIKIYEVF